MLAKIAELPEPDRAMAKRLHAIIKVGAPALLTETWYGMPAYAKDGKVVCFFQSAQKFKTRYATFGFSDTAPPRLPREREGVQVVALHRRFSARQVAAGEDGDVLPVVDAVASSGGASIPARAWKRQSMRPSWRCTRRGRGTSPAAER